MVHPVVKAIYDNNGLDYIQRAEDRYEAHFIQKTANQPKTVEINELWRTKFGGFNTEEFLWWKQTTYSTDYRGNKMTLFQIVGKYDKPIPFYGYDEKAGKSMAMGIQSHEETFEIPFTDEKLQELLDKGLITGRTRFAIQSQSRNYGDIDWEDFRYRPFSELVFHGKTGLWPAYANIENEAQQQQQSQQSNISTAEEEEIAKKKKKAADIETAAKELERETGKKVTIQQR